MHKNRDSKVNPVVIGAGISGLAASNRLNFLGVEHKLLEKLNTAGGLTRSIFVDDYTFDYTGHFLHLAKLKHPHDLGVYQSGDWIQVDRKAFCFAEERFIDAPYQYNLGQLPKPVRDYCLETYRSAASKASFSESPKLSESLLEYFLRTCGEGITATFLKPYNEKLLATSLENLNAVAINRFFPSPNKELIEAGASEVQSHSQVAYNSRFWYPKHNGIQQLIDSMRKETVTRGNVQSIDLDRRIITTDREEISYSKAYSSVPLDVVLRSVSNGLPQSREYSDKLSHASVLAFQIGLAKDVSKELKDKHWVYVADPRIPFHRVGIYSNFNDSMAPKGCSSLYVEVGLNSNQTYDSNQIAKSVIQGLDQLGWIDTSAIDVLVAHRINHGYIHFNHAWQETVPTAIAALEAKDFYPIGRYGKWNYISMEDSVIGAWETVSKTQGLD